MSTDTFYPIGTHVLLRGLQAAPEHNGKTGVVESTAGERQRIKLLDDDNSDDKKVLGIRPKNLELAPRAVDTLTVKELKTVLEACGYNGTLSGMDKRDLQDAVTELCSPERTAAVLVEQARKQQTTTATTADRNKNPTSNSSVNKDQIQTAADRMATMDPAQLRQQAAMMKAMPKDQLRRTNPMFANMDDGQIDQMISQFEMMASNPAMMQQAADQVKNMTPEELQRQQDSVLGANNNNAGSNTSNNSTSAAPTASSSTTSANAPSPSSNPSQMLSQMNPEQLKQQAAMMRSMPPHQIRSMHPQFSNMSDAQIEQMASQMEMMADNPAMLKMAADTMGSMTPEQIAEIQQGRLPNTGMGANNGDSSAPGPTMDQAANLLTNMNGKQVKQMLRMAKENPDMLKTAMPGADTRQVEKLVNGLDGMDEKTLDRIIAVLSTLQKAFSPVIKAYQSANQAVGGHLFKILSFAVVAMFAYWWFGGTTTATSPMVAPTMDDAAAASGIQPESDIRPEDDEFAEL